MRRVGKRVTFSPSPGGFPRGRPALTILVSVNVLPPEPDGPEEPQCSSKGCREPASWALLWNNPKLHAPDYRKTWLACDEHRVTLGNFLEVRGFLREVTPFGAASDAPIS